jgi:PKD repeat protein
VLSNEGNVIGGSTVVVLDGPDAGRVAGTNSNGEYRFDQLRAGNTNFVARANGYEEDRRGTFVNGSNTLNFTLRELPRPEPPPAPLSFTTSVISSGAGFAELRFTAVGTLPPSTYHWDFGDGGGSSRGPVDTHLYLAEGDYDVRLTATPTGGGTPVVVVQRVVVRF